MFEFIHLLTLIKIWMSIGPPLEGKNEILDSDRCTTTKLQACRDRLETTYEVWFE